MDFKELDVSEDSNRYALVFQDCLTKWPEVFPVKDRTAPTVAKCLAELVWRHGVPTKIIHDWAAKLLAIRCLTGHCSYSWSEAAPNFWRTPPD